MRICYYIYVGGDLLQKHQVDLEHCVQLSTQNNITEIARVLVAWLFRTKATIFFCMTLGFYE